MKAISYKRHRFQAATIRQTVWLYYRFTLSLRDVENLLAEREIEVSYETPLLDDEIWSGDCGQPAALSGKAGFHLAPR